MVLDKVEVEVVVLEVIEAIEGPLTSNLPAGEGLAQESKTKLEQALADVTSVARRELESIKLAHLLPKLPRKEVESHGGDEAAQPVTVPEDETEVP